MTLGEDNKADPFWILRGPHCVGELCCSTKFQVVDAKSDESGFANCSGECFEISDAAQQTGTMEKLSDRDAMGACKQMVTDADNFSFKLKPGASVEQKAVALTAMTMLDYYFFEDGGAFECNPFADPGETCCRINCCTEYCCGAKCTWACTMEKQETDSSSV